MTQTPPDDRRATRAAARRAVGDFLSTRRARTTPEQAGLRTGSIGRRRVPGLRREEVALLAGISVEYYARLERGDVGGASDEVLRAVTRALRFDAVESAHLDTLVRAARHGESEREAAPLDVRPGLARVVDQLEPAAAFVRNGLLDILHANATARGLYAEVFEDPETPPNLCRYLFLDERSRSFYRNWEVRAAGAVGTLRAEAARTPDDPHLRSLVDGLSGRSAEFARLWEGHDVGLHRAGEQPFRHAVAGDLDLDYESLEVTADPGLTLLVYHARPGSDAEQALAALRRPAGGAGEPRRRGGSRQGARPDVP